MTDVHTFEQNVREDYYDQLLALNFFDDYVQHADTPSIAQHAHEHAPIRTAVPRAFADAGYVTHGVGITLMSGNNSWQHCLPCWTDGYSQVSFYGW